MRKYVLFSMVILLAQFCLLFSVMHDVIVFISVMFKGMLHLF